MHSFLKAMLVSTLALCAPVISYADEIPTAQVLEALILAGPEQPVTFEVQDYLGVLETQGLSPDMPGVLASLFGSLATASAEDSDANHAALSHSCQSMTDQCSVTVLYVDEFDGEKSEPAVILSFTLIDGKLDPTVPVSVDLAG